jgi:hypothetical protein
MRKPVSVSIEKRLISDFHMAFKINSMDNTISVNGKEYRSFSHYIEDKIKKDLHTFTKLDSKKKENKE